MYVWLHVGASEPFLLVIATECIPTSEVHIYFWAAEKIIAIMCEDSQAEPGCPDETHESYSAHIMII